MKAHDVGISGHVSIIVIRVAALVVLIAGVGALWNFMLWLPWQVDCILAVAAAWAYAYTFEREDRA
jgi:hypothetical protein